MEEGISKTTTMKGTDPGAVGVQLTVNANHGAYRWMALFICFLAFMIAYVPRLSLGPLAPFMKADLGLTKAQIGLFASAAVAGYGVFLIPAGWICDKWGVRWTLCFGQVVAGCCLIAMLFAQSYTMGLVVMFVAGLGMGFLSPSTGKGIVEWFAIKERGMAMGIKQTSVNAGGLITAVTLPTVAIAFGWRWGFAILGAVAILSGILSAVFYKDAPKSASSASAAAPVKKESWLMVFKTREIWLISMAGIALYIAEMGVLIYFVLFLKTQLLVPVVAAGFLLGAIDVGGFCGKPIAGIISDRLMGGKRKPTFILLGAISTIFTVGFALMSTGTPQWVILVCAVFFGFAAVGWGGIYFTMVAECAGKDNAATCLGASSLLLVIGNIIGVPLFGHISDVTGTWTWSWIYLIVMSVVGTAALFFVREEKRRLST